ncbi:MAG TPA: ester cyclase [Steroidobacteraceae bacterium]|nr:ester cyclase [Steroidobacteraceae bacterium]
MNESRMIDFARGYTAAWSSHIASDIAAFYSQRGSLAINGGTPAVGRQAIADLAQSFITAYPDLLLTFDRLEPRGHRVLYYWSLTGTHIGPGGNGNAVRISGYEDWQFGPDGLIADSQGHYDAADWDRQLNQPAR